MRNLFLYTTTACHLCVQAEEIIAPVLVRNKLNLQLIEISDSDALIERYGVIIPVLRVEGREVELNWPFNLDEFLSFIESE